MKCVAFLRALNNVGGHAVSMEYLRTVFEAEGFTSVEMFGASGNVVFDGDAEDVAGLERVIEQMLHDALGYDVTTFIRTDAEVRNIARHKPFLDATLKTAVALNVAMFKESLDEKATQAIMALKTRSDSFQVRGREVYWLSQTRQTESSISNAVFEIAVGRPSTMRGINTIRQLAQKHGPR
ncbi:MAG TPA: DUF1697 domain-containing protein [Vicinamibacterales bacterium]|nr:DUF1697 domain-containing protein [Vicinamibacterales bacterium]